MATIIPRANIPQTEIGALPRVRAPQAPDLTSQNQLLEVAKQGLQQYGERIQARNDTAALMQARRELSEFETEAFNPNNTEGVGQYRGSRALEAGSIVGKADTRIGEIRARLTPRQQAQFDGIAGNFRDGLAGRLNTYMDREHTAYVEAEQKAAVDNLSADAVTAGIGGDFARQDQVATEVLGMARQKLLADGAGAETIKAAERELASNIRTQTVLGMVGAQPFAAADYYARYADQMEPADRMRVDAVLRPVVEDAENDALADAILAGREVAPSAEVATGVDAQIETLEGTGQNPGSSARGVGQFVDKTWLEVIRKHRPDLAQGKSNAEILLLKDDPTLGREMIARYREDNARSLSARGVPLTPENLYAAHHFGSSGAAKFAAAPNGTPMTRILSAREINANPYLRDKTVGEVKANWAQRGLQVAGASQGPSSMGVPRTQADALAYADQTIADPRERKQVKAKIREKWAIAEAQADARDKQLSENAYTAISENTDPRRPLREIIGPEAYALASRKGQLDSLDAYRRNVLTQTTVRDDPVLADALQREAVLSPTTFRRKNLYGLADRLSAGTLADLLKKQEDVDKPDKQTEWATTNERIDQGYLILGLDPSQDPTGGSPARKQQRAAFSEMYRNAERDFVQREKRQPRPDEADRLLRNVTRAAALRQSEDRLTVESTGSLAGYGATLSERDRAEIVADFQADTGRAPTEAEIVGVASRYQMRGP